MPIDLKLNLRTNKFVFDKDIMENSDPQTVLSEHAKLNEMRFEIVEATLWVEQEFETYILKYLFPQQCEKSLFFQGYIIKTDLISFSSKRRILLEILRKEKLIKIAKQTELNELVIKIMNYRDAFTHGRFNKINNDAVLNFYQGGNQTLEINQQNIDDIKRVFNHFYAIWNGIFESYLLK